jgi:hypothetical protein
MYDDLQRKTGCTQLRKHASTPSSDPLVWHTSTAVRNTGAYGTFGWNASACADHNRRVLCSSKGLKRTIRRKTKERHLPVDASKTRAIVAKVDAIVAERGAAMLSPPKILCFSFNPDLTDAIVHMCSHSKHGIKCFDVPESIRTSTTGRNPMVATLKSFLAHAGPAMLFLSRDHDAGVNIPAAQYVILCEPSVVENDDRQAVGRIRGGTRAQSSDTKAFIFFTKDTIEEHFKEHNREPDALLSYAKLVRTQVANGALSRASDAAAAATAAAAASAALSDDDADADADGDDDNSGDDVVVVACCAGHAAAGSHIAAMDVVESPAALAVFDTPAAAAMVVVDARSPVTDAAPPSLVAVAPAVHHTVPGQGMAVADRECRKRKRSLSDSPRERCARAAEERARAWCRTDRQQ